MQKPLTLKLRPNDRVIIAELLRAEDHALLLITEMGYFYRVIIQRGSESVEAVWTEVDPEIASHGN